MTDSESESDPIKHPCPQCGSPRISTDKSFYMRSSCSNGHQWYTCKHGSLCLGVVQPICFCPIYQKPKPKPKESSAKVYVHKKRDRNPSKKQT